MKVSEKLTAQDQEITTVVTLSDVDQPVRSPPRRVTRSPTADRPARSPDPLLRTSPGQETGLVHRGSTLAHSAAHRRDRLRSSARRRDA